MWAPFERQKVKVHIFDITNFSGFVTLEFTTKEYLILPKSSISTYFKFLTCPGRKAEEGKVFVIQFLLSSYVTSHIELKSHESN